MEPRAASRDATPTRDATRSLELLHRWRRSRHGAGVRAQRAAGRLTRAVLIAGDPEFFPAGADPAAGEAPTYVASDGVSSQLTCSADLVAPHILRALCNVRIDRVVTSCVADHAVFLATNGDTYVYGRNDSGQCGVAPARALSAPVRLDAQRDFVPPLTERIVDAATGAAHTLLVTARGEVYAAGSNALGQCGMAGERRLVSFRRLQQGPFVEADDGVAMVSCGAAFSLVLTRSGKGMWRSERRGSPCSVHDGLDRAWAAGHGRVWAPVHLARGRAVCGACTPGASADTGAYCPGVVRRAPCNGVRGTFCGIS